MISFGNFGTGKILYSSLKVHCKSPHSWPSSCGKKQFLPSCLLRSWRECFSPCLLTHSWGKFVTCTGFAMYLSWFIKNFKFPNSWLHHSYRNFPVPKLPNDIIRPFLVFQLFTNMPIPSKSSVSMTLTESLLTSLAIESE